MREIVHLQTGQCGNQIGAAFWYEFSPNPEAGRKPLLVLGGTNIILRVMQANHLWRARPRWLWSVRLSNYFLWLIVPDLTLLAL